MNIIADSNTFLAVVLGEPEKDTIIKVAEGKKTIAPEFLHYEIGNALSAMVKRKQLNQEEAIEAQSLLNQVPVRLVSVNKKEALKIALDFNIYAYDAYFLQCAIEYSCPLMTLDKRMTSVAKDLNIQLLEVRI